MSCDVMDRPLTETAKTAKTETAKPVQTDIAAADRPGVTSESE